MIGFGSSERIMSEAEWKGLCDRFMEESIYGVGHRDGSCVPCKNGTQEPSRRPAVLILPPDITRCYSYAGEITAYLYEKLQGDFEVKVMPAVGTHMQMPEEELKSFFPGVPMDAYLTHDWKKDCANLGVISSEVVSELTGGKCTWPIDVLLNKHLVDGSFDHIISVGQVVPHEVVGLANYTKNLMVGLGGRDMINKSHMVSAICNIETILGNIDSPVRAIFDYAQREFLDRYGIHFILTVTKERDSQADLYGVFIGQERDTYVAAARLSQETNITYLPERAKKVVCWLDPAEFRSTWVGNKSVYRTRMAIADGGELVVIAPGLRQFGENEETDSCIRKYGYIGTEKIMKLYEEGAFENLDMVSAHLVHGSSDGRFRITYAIDPSNITPEEIEGVGYEWINVADAMEKYKPLEKETGYYTVDGEECYFVKAPAVGLWRTR